MALSDFFTNGHTPLKGYVRALNKTAAFTVAVPKGAVVRQIYVRNDTANAVTGGIKVGTTLAGTDVHAAIAVAASAVVNASPLIGAINTAGVRTLYFDAVTAWNSAQVDVVVEFDYLVN